MSSRKASGIKSPRCRVVVGEGILGRRNEPCSAPWVTKTSLHSGKSSERAVPGVLQEVQKGTNNAGGGAYWPCKDFGFWPREKKLQTTNHGPLLCVCVCVCVYVLLASLSQNTRRHGHNWPSFQVEPQSDALWKWDMSCVIYWGHPDPTPPTVYLPAHCHCHGTCTCLHRAMWSRERVMSPPAEQGLFQQF
jgi:hypothetical protein